MKRFFVVLLVLIFIFIGQITTVIYAKQPVISTCMYIMTDQDDYRQIETDEISKTVVHVVEETYPGAGIAEAFIDKTGNYKLIIVVDRNSKIVYINSTGEWFNP
ncbi:hypothetical protein [Aquimarina addita]